MFNNQEKKDQIKLSLETCKCQSTVNQLIGSIEICSFCKEDEKCADSVWIGFVDSQSMANNLHIKFSLNPHQTVNINDCSSLYVCVCFCCLFYFDSAHHMCSQFSGIIQNNSHWPVTIFELITQMIRQREKLNSNHSAANE